MRFILPRICALMVLAVGCVAVALGADPQPYKVDLVSTGDKSMDSTLRATSDLISLRSSAPVSPYGLIARARSDVDRLKTVLESFGYYQSKVTIKVDALALNDPGLADELTALPKKHDARVQISFTLGPLYHVRRITIDGELPPAAQGVLSLKPGAPAVAATVLAAGSRLMSFLGEQGYAFAKVDSPVAYEDKTDPVLDVVFHVDTGPRVNIGEIRFEGLKRVHEKILRRRLLLHTGEPYKTSAVENSRKDLLSLLVFASINVDVGTAVDATGGVPITFKFRERLRHTFGIGAAYSTDLGGSGTLNWGDRNVFGNAEQLTATTSIINLGGSSSEGVGYDVGVKYSLPDFGHRDQTLQLAVSALKQYLIAYDQTALSTGATLTRKLNKLWTVSAGVTATEETINQIVSVTQETVDQDGTEVTENNADYHVYDYTLLALPLTLSYDSTNLASPLDDPTHGMRDSLSLSPTRSLGHSNATFLITQVRAAVYFDLDGILPTDPGRSVLAVRALAGLASGASEFSLPPDQRFYGGGSASIRGYPYQSVGPYFPVLSSKGEVIGSTNDPIGATSISAGAVEFRQRFGQSLGAAFFVDGGQVGNKLTWWPSRLFLGVGGGVRYYTPIGPVRLDVAVPLKRYDSDPEAFQVYIGLGQAF
jgi:translocation and assembly module TamA